MNRSQVKSQRLLQIEQLLWAHPEGLTRSEIARRLNIDRSNITKYLDAGHLPPGIYEDDLDGNKLKFDRSADLTKASFNLHEVLALHLAARLLATRTDKQNPHAASALRKLAIALRRLDQNISQHMLAAADVMTEDSAFRDPVYLDVLERLTEAWSAGRKVKVSHQMENGRVFEYTFAPYFIEPYAVGQTAHVIGWREPPGALRTFKIERLRAVHLLHDRYEIPADFDPAALLRNAWGIWFSEAEPVEVVLRFHPHVAGRVQESRWHRDQQIDMQPDGYLLWRTRVAAVQEMLPWIRGWGADVEVIEPVELREELRRTVQRLGEVYAMAASNTPLLPHLIPYAKTNPKNPNEVHRLLYHLIDVGQTALLMWQEVFTDGIRRRLAKMLGLSVDQCGRLFALLAALHDLGKAGPAYQKKYAPAWLRTELENAGLALDGRNKAYDPAQLAHGTVSAWALVTLLPQVLGLDQLFAYKIAVAVGGHHGIWPRDDELDHISDSKHPQWEQVRRDLLNELVSVFNPPANAAKPASAAELNAFLIILAGLTSVADWVGSQNDRYFGYVQQPLAAEEYVRRAHAKARTALRELGWLGWHPTGDSQTFSEMFSYLGIAQPRSVQEQVIALAGDQQSPTMAVIEATTGIGKTELALYLADCWLQQDGGRGLYVAMPTQATSNQMYTRVGEFLHRRYPDMPINFHLVHGQAVWLDELKQQVELQGVGDDTQAHVAAESWFGPRKRTLLAPFGVGTVDQALMSVLQTRHFFVRLFGLSHKVAIFDEVHAYDIYMNTIFHLLLTWLNAIGTSVIILSATLPSSTRRALVKAYTGQDLAADEECYPALTITNAEQQRTWQLPKPQPYTVQLEWLADRAAAAGEIQEEAEQRELVVDYLRQQLAAGGYAAVICNTVGRTQAVMKAIEQARERGEMAIADEDLLLFHSRFPPIWRKEIEQQVQDRFGKGGSRQGTAIVVATQVIEQSLDIDFDLMISDVAPIDLLIQRAGRLHRHAENDDKRHGLARKLVLVRPGQRPGGAPDFGKSIFVYDEYILLRTYSVLQNAAAITIPDDTTTLIEEVYDPERSPQLPPGVDQGYLDQLRQKMDKGEGKAQAKAEMGLVLAPSSRGLPGQGTLDLEEDDPQVHATLRARTRDIDFSLDLVCLHRDEQGPYVFAGSGDKLRVDLDQEPDRDEIKMLQQNTVTLQNRSAGQYFLDQQTPRGWRNTAALRYSRYAIFEDGICDLPQHTLKLSRRYGLEILKKERA